MTENITRIDKLTRHARKRLHIIRMLVMRETHEKALQYDYGKFSVRDKEVLDIGAADADSALWFMEKGASKVYAYECDQAAFASGLIKIKNAYLSDYIKSYNKYVGTRANEIPLEEIINTHRLANCVLKCDTEGAEYDIILNCDKKLFNDAFSFVMVEYHYGYLNLKKYLEENGYEVSYRSPKITDQGMDNGLIYGKRIGAT